MLKQKRLLYEVFSKVNGVNLSEYYLNEDDFSVENDKDIRKLHVSLSSAGVGDIEEEYPEWLVNELINNEYIEKSEKTFSWFFTERGREKFPSPHDLKNWLLTTNGGDDQEQEIEQDNVEDNTEDNSGDDFEIENLNEDVLDEEKKQSIINEFIDYANQYLDIEDKPNIIISNNPKEASEMRSFGKFTPEIKEIVVVGINRNLADVLRTLAHEMVHYKQYQEDRLYEDSGSDGTDIENEANSEAAVIMRQFGRNNPIIFE